MAGGRPGGTRRAPMSWPAGFDSPFPRGGRCGRSSTWTRRRITNEKCGMEQRKRPICSSVERSSTGSAGSRRRFRSTEISTSCSGALPRELADLRRRRRRLAPDPGSGQALPSRTMDLQSRLRRARGPSRSTSGRPEATSTDPGRATSASPSVVGEVVRPRPALAGRERCRSNEDRDPDRPAAHVPRRSLPTRRGPVPGLERGSATATCRVLGRRCSEQRSMTSRLHRVDVLLVCSSGGISFNSSPSGTHGEKYVFEEFTCRLTLVHPPPFFFFFLLRQVETLAPVLSRRAEPLRAPVPPNDPPPPPSPQDGSRPRCASFVGDRCSDAFDSPSDRRNLNFRRLPRRRCGGITERVPAAAQGQAFVD